MTKNKRVCIVRSNSVNPDSRVEKEAWTLKNAGYDVHILAWDRASDEYEKDENIVVDGLAIPITRLGHRASFGEGFKNIRSYLAFQFHMRKWLKKHKFDIVHACDFDTAFFSRGTVKKNRRFVFDIFDFLYGEPRGILQKCVKRAQLSIINRADATIICTEEREKQISGSKPKKLVVVHNTPMENQKTETKFPLPASDRTKIVYVGVLQDLRLLKEIAEAMKSLPGAELHVGGFGKYEEFFKAAAEREDNIFFHGRLSYDKTLALEEAGDIMLGIYDPEVENHRFAAPNKFYESLILGKPILMVHGTGMSDVVKTNDIGVLIEYSGEGFINGVRELTEKKHLWDEMSKRMQLLYKENYSWKTMEKRLLEMYSCLSESLGD